jgi:hypothetical protein
MGYGLSNSKIDELELNWSASTLLIKDVILYESLAKNFYLTAVQTAPLKRKK